MLKYNNLFLNSPSCKRRPIFQIIYYNQLLTKYSISGTGIAFHNKMMSLIDNELIYNPIRFLANIVIQEKETP